MKFVSWCVGFAQLAYCLVTGTDIHVKLLFWYYDQYYFMISIIS